MNNILRCLLLTISFFLLPVTAVICVATPTVSGYASSTCALPGEQIVLSTEHITIDPAVTIVKHQWEIGPLTVTADGCTVTVVDRYESDEGQTTIPAFYYMNGYGIRYSFKTSDSDEWHYAPVSPDHTILVHNYHRMNSVDAHGTTVDTRLRSAAQRASSEGTTLPRVYIEDEADMRAMLQYISNSGNDCGANVDFHLMKSISLASSDLATSATFRGNLHGNGNVITITDAQAQTSETPLTLFSTNEGNVYNLGIVGAAIASDNSCLIENSFSYGADVVLGNSGTIRNCFTNSRAVTPEQQFATYASEDSWTYGMVAYHLNGYYIYRRETPAVVTNPDVVLAKSAAAPAHLYLSDAVNVSYINALYRNGDYQYARCTTDGNEYLRTSPTVNYGSTATSHDTSHAIDHPRAVGYVAATDDAPATYSGFYRPLFDEAHIPGTGSTATQPKNDYIFFGQSLVSDAAAALPHSFTPATRVYRAYGYMNSSHHGSSATDASTDAGFYFNAAAHVLNPSLTAVAFTVPSTVPDASPATVPDASPSGFTLDLPTSLTSFTVAPAVTRNLLVYSHEADSETSVFHAGVYAADAAEGTISYHTISPDLTIANLRLVERATADDAPNDFNVPREFAVTNSICYTRRPRTYADATGAAWEGICLPFTATKVMASINGEMTHFYGMPTAEQLSAPHTNDKTLHHEYWLRGLVDVNVSDDRAEAVFLRPGAASSSLFCPEGAEVVSSYHFHNTWFADEAGFGNHGYDSHGDGGSVEEGRAWYTREHAFADYLPLTADVPYIVSFPGERYHEFDLSNAFLNNTRTQSLAPQTVTFSHAVADAQHPVTIHVTDGQLAAGRMNTTAKGYHHIGTYSHLPASASSGRYCLDASGNAFSHADADVFPFRTYMTAPVGTTAKSMTGDAIFVGGSAETPLASRANGDAPREKSIGDMRRTDGASDAWMEQYGDVHSIVIISSRTADAVICSESGQVVRAVRVFEGRNVYTGFAPGVYLVNGTKLVVR